MKAKWSFLDLIAVCVYAFLYAPIAVLILFSFEKSKIAVEWTGFTFNWYLQLFQDQALGLAVFNSLFVATIAVAMAAVMGTMAAVGLARLKFAGKNIYRGAVMLPIIIPEIAMAVSALTLFIFLGVHLSLATVIVSHVVFCVSYMVLTVMARLDGINPSLEEAARDLGASPLSAFFKVTLPLLAPGIVAGSLMAFVLSLDDFIITQFNAGVGATTLPLRIYSMVKFGVSPEINALSTLMIVATVNLTLIAELVRRKGAQVVLAT
jgi:spermidine/putrescine transport system permease protein